jgi:hypothetical protein
MLILCQLSPCIIIIKLIIINRGDASSLICHLTRNSKMGAAYLPSYALNQADSRLNPSTNYFRPSPARASDRWSKEGGVMMVGMAA